MNLKFDEYGQWVKAVEGHAYVGISDPAQKMLGTIVFIRFPEVGTSCSSKQEIGTVEALKTAQEIYSPIKGTICRINEELADSPARINKQPYESWLYILKDFDLNEYEKLYGLEDYEKIVKLQLKNIQKAGSCSSC